MLAIIPKTENKYLIDGKIWVNAKDYSIVRIEGQPARDPSFWVHNVHFVHTYQRVGQFWFASSTHSTSEVRIFGRSELTIENSDYALNPPKKRTRGSRFYGEPGPMRKVHLIIALVALGAIRVGDRPCSAFQRWWRN